MITLNYLTHGVEREHFHKLNFYFLNKIKKENKAKIRLQVLMTGTERANDWYEYASRKLEGIEFKVIPFTSIPSNYMDKTRHAAHTSGRYMVKWDEDYFINNHVWDYLIENCHLLDSGENLSLAPLSSTGIPTSELFVNNYFDEKDIHELHQSLLGTKFSLLWGYDYSHLNEFTLDSDSWDGEAFYSATNAINYHYKGINPYRIGSSPQNLINDKLLQNLEKFVEKQDYNITCLNRYFCNHLNMMLTDEYRTIISDRSLVVDGVDEVPFNKYAVKTGKNLLFVENGFGIHIMYNTIWDEGTNFQNQLDFYAELERGSMK